MEDVPVLGRVVPSSKRFLRGKLQDDRDRSRLAFDPFTARACHQNLAAVGRAVAKLGDWDFGRNYVVWKVLQAKQFTFIGSRQKIRKIAFSGSGKALARLLTSGVSIGITKTSSRKLDLEIIGKGGAIAIGVTRIRRDGKLRDV